MWTLSKLRAGDWVIVKPKEEILASLDKDGALDGMPFMPEMLAFCGRRMRVATVAHKTCDPAYKTGGRRLDRTVHLEGTRCNGSAHGGCEAECNFFWKDAWLKVAPEAAAATSVVAANATTMSASESAALPTMRGDCYTCQATELNKASVRLPWWNPRQYILDVVSGNHSIKQVFKVLALSWSRQLLRVPVGHRMWRRLNDWTYRRLTGRPAPYFDGLVPPGEKTPTATLDLKPGEMVRVKPLPEIAVTLDRNSKNRGMWFDIEMTTFCEQTFKVRRRVNKIIDERTGKMMEMKNPCITLEGVLCSGLHSSERLLCPRAITPYWREAWLDRIKQ
jgi:hypothetical protein